MLGLKTKSGKCHSKIHLFVTAVNTCVLCSLTSLIIVSKCYCKSSSWSVKQKVPLTMDENGRGKLFHFASVPQMSRPYLGNCRKPLVSLAFTCTELTLTVWSWWWRGKPSLAGASWPSRILCCQLWLGAQCWAHLDACDGSQRKSVCQAEPPGPRVLGQILRARCSGLRNAFLLTCQKCSSWV